MARIAKSAVPNAFTFANLGCGVLSLLISFQGNYRLSAIFIVLACLADRYDGRVARFLNVSSDLGKELDSLADLVSFGVAPSILIFNIYGFTNLGILGYLLVLLFPIAGAYRLARFNTTEFDGSFYGIPITLAGMIIAAFAFLTAINPINSGVAIILIIALSYLMVCRHRFKKF
jgi:CDP-diacylglycerol--serine O-phosphatidyltransferase